MKRLTSTILALTLGCTLAGCQANQPNHHVLKSGGTYNQTLANPYEWALQQFSDGPISGPDVSDYARIVLTGGLKQTFADLGADGTQELFLRQDCPARMWEVLVFTPVNGGYRYLGSFPAGAIVLNSNQPSVLVYEPCGGHNGYIKTYKYDGIRFVCTDVQPIAVGDGAPEENNRMRSELFPKDRVIRWAKTPNKIPSPVL